MKFIIKIFFILTICYIKHGLLAQQITVSINNYYADMVEKKMQELGFETIFFEKNTHLNFYQYENFMRATLRMIRQQENITHFLLNEYRVSDDVDILDFYKNVVAWSYSGGIPPYNFTYNIGDFVLSRASISNDLNHTGFDIFSKNTIMTYSFSKEEKSSIKSDVITQIDFLKTILPPKSSDFSNESMAKIISESMINKTSFANTHTQQINNLKLISLQTNSLEKSFFLNVDESSHDHIQNKKSKPQQKHKFWFWLFTFSVVAGIAWRLFRTKCLAKKRKNNLDNESCRYD